MQIRFSGAGMISGGLARMCFHYSGGVFNNWGK